MSEIKLPELSAYFELFSLLDRKKIRDFAIAAIELDRASRTALDDNERAEIFKTGHDFGSASRPAGEAMSSVASIDAFGNALAFSNPAPHASAPHSPTPFVEATVKCGRCATPVIAPTATPAVGEPVYQVNYMGNNWVDVPKHEHAASLGARKRTLYRAPPAVSEDVREED